jgi:uncharacterized protein YjbJ (UPF0337 family)
MTAPYPNDRAEEVSETSVGELIGNISNDLSQLFRQEVELAKAELKQEASKAGKAAGMLGGAGFAGYLAVVLLSFALVFALANVMDAGWAAHGRHDQGGRGMAEEPDRLRQDIENTRASLTRDVDLLAEKTSPTKVAQRRWSSIKEKVMGTSEHARHAAGDTASSAVGTVQDKMGTVQDTVQDKASRAGDVASEKAHDAADAVRSAPQAVVSQTQGNPLAAGIIAFGVGMLAATLIPVTDAERRAGQELKDRSGDLTDKVKDVASDLKDDVSGSVQEAAGRVQDTARDAAQTTKQQAVSSAQDAKQQTQQAAQNA